MVAWMLYVTAVGVVLSVAAVLAEGGLFEHRADPQGRDAQPAQVAQFADQALEMAAAPAPAGCCHW